ncbi:MAG: polysaccharide export protein [Cyanothece sp. SIO1E1]|nr:polysaccharide export protein [Cyanothece sp. SIO1E1]
MLKIVRPVLYQPSISSLKQMLARVGMLPGAALSWLLVTSSFVPMANGQTSPSIDSLTHEAQLHPSLTIPSFSAEQLKVQSFESPTRIRLEQQSRPLQTNSDDPFDLYYLGPGDGIFVSVQRFPDLSFQATLDLQGNVIVPILGAVSLQGLTLQQAEERIRTGYEQFVFDPDVNLTLVAQRPVQVTVIGEVQRPGLYPLAAPQVSTALLSAGGAKGMADLRQILIRRQLANGAVLEKDIDLFTPLRDANALPDIRLADGDVLVVPRLELTGVNDYDRTLAARSTLAQPQINVRLLNYAGTGGGLNATGGNLGNLQLPGGSTFVDALAAISPNLVNAKLSKIGLVRFDPEQGRAMTTELNGKKALLGDASQNPSLEDNDVIVVGRNLLGKITFALNTITQPFQDTLGFLLFFDSISDVFDD